MKKRNLTITHLAVVGLVLSACSPQGFEVINSVANKTTQNIACKSTTMEEQFWDGMKEYLIQEKTVLKADDLQAAFKSSFSELRKQNPQIQEAQFSALKKQMSSLIETILAEAPEGERVDTSDELLILISSLDVGDRSTPFKAYLQSKIRRQLTDLQKTIRTLDLSCGSGSEVAEVPDSESIMGPQPSPEGEAPATDSDSSMIARDYQFHKNQALSAGSSLAAFGGRWAVATAYQSCQAVILPSMNAKSPSLEGIKEVGEHSDGVGTKRAIASLSKVVQSHYYLKDVPGYGAGCFDLHKSPLIYDYGGKPYGTTAADSPIDFFKNNGSGTSVLGIDCSAFVYTSFASAGLRLKAGRDLKASDSWAWGSGTYVEPQENGLTCFNKATFTPNSNLKSGDVVAVYGHVLIIDKVGADPFGIRFASKASDCSKLSYKNFDFVVAQSSPSKSAIGINYYEAKDYLATSSKFRNGLQKYAQYACRAKFESLNYTPNIGTLSVIRHKGTSECVSGRVRLANEACIASCGSLVR